MNHLVTLLQALATFIIGPFGISLITVAVAGAFLGAMLHWWPSSSGVKALFYGACAFSAAYFASMV